MTLSGSVRECDAVKKAVVIDVVGKNGWGNHVTGSVRVILPSGA